MTDTLRDEREPKLPVWAQDLINGLRRRVNELESDVRELQWMNPNTDTFLVQRYPADDWSLPKRAEIRFRLGERQEITARIIGAPYAPRPMLQLSSAWTGLVVKPQVSNVIYLGVGE